MKKTLILLCILLMILCSSCARETINYNVSSFRQSLSVETVNGNKMVKADDIAALFALDTYIGEDGMICFEQEGKTVKLDLASQYVFQYGYRVDYLKDNCVNKDGEVYIPLRFVTHFLRIEGVLIDNKYIVADSGGFSLYDVIKFLPEEIWGAYNEAEYPSRENILAQVDQLRSMGIDEPNIDMSRVIWNRPVDERKKDIILYNYKYEKPEEISKLTDEDFETIGASQLLEEDIIKNAQARYADLVNQDLTGWTYGELNEYYENLPGHEKQYSDEEIRQIEIRGITIDDMKIFGKYNYTVETMLVQTDEKLKEIIEEYYQMNYDIIRQYAEKYPVE